MKNFIKHVVYIFSAITFLCFACVAFSEGMEIKYGLWETKSIVTVPFGGGVQEHISQDCITENINSPDQLMQDVEGCEILDKDVGSNTMRWTVSCINADFEMIGEGNVQSTETTFFGSMKITATVNDQEIEMNTSWDGKYVGDCS